MTFRNPARLMVALFAIGILASSVRADDYKLDPVHSFVIFRVGHLGTSYLYGRFNEPTGTFAIDENDAAKTSFDITIPAENIDTHNDKRDQHLKGPDFFNAKQYPEITFKSTEVKKESDKKWKVTGDLTMHGVTKSITLTVNLVGTGKGMQGETRTGVETTFDVKRTDFGISGLPGAVGEHVNVTVSVEGIKQ